MPAHYELGWLLAAPITVAAARPGRAQTVAPAASPATELYSSAPLVADVADVAGVGTLASTVAYGLHSLDLGLTAGPGYVTRSVTNAGPKASHPRGLVRPGANAEVLPRPVKKTPASNHPHTLDSSSQRRSATTCALPPTAWH
ncbi:MAG: hypothetical protein ACLPYS_11345 [Vulcanimicrobiaceae bacterium]